MPYIVGRVSVILPKTLSDAEVKTLLNQDLPEVCGGKVRILHSGVFWDFPLYNIHILWVKPAAEMEFILAMKRRGVMAQRMRNGSLIPVDQQVRRHKY